MKEGTIKVLSVGHCSFDHGHISRLLKENFDVEVIPVPSAEEAVQSVKTGRFDLVLVNRRFDADGDSGLDLIKRLQSDEATRPTPVALISNHSSAQDQAVALGARRGFGKDALNRPETRELLASLLGRPA